MPPHQPCVICLYFQELNLALSLIGLLHCLGIYAIFSIKNCLFLD